VNASHLLFFWAGKSKPTVEPDLSTCESNRDLEACAKLMLNSIGCHDLARRVKVRWNARLSSTAGMASYKLWQVSLNPRLAEFGPAEIDITLRHELAHLVAKFRAGRRRIRPHGPEWKQACADLGLPGEKRCHSLPLPRRRVTRKHFYRCPQCKVEVERVRPFRERVACLNCCRKYNHGRYDDRFRLEKTEKGGTPSKGHLQSNSAA
jgi:SprT protein